MSDEFQLKTAADLLALTLQEISDEIISESWQTSVELNKVFGANYFVSVAIEVLAFLLHALSRSLPKTDGDYLNDFAYSPIVDFSSKRLGELVEHIQDEGVFSMARFSGDRIEAEALETIEIRGQQFAQFSKLIFSPGSLHESNALRHAAKVLANLVGKHRLTFALAVSENRLYHALCTLNFSKTSLHFQKGLPPDVRAYLRMV